MPVTESQRRLRDLTTEALDLADSLCLDDVAIQLNAALVRLDGAGQPPRRREERLPSAAPA